MTPTSYLLRAEVSQIQKFIFRVPRLLAMVGADRQVGGLVNKVLPEKIIKLIPSITIDPIPDIDQIQEIEKKLLFTCLEDLSANLKAGILHSAGGHFEALTTPGAKSDLLKEIYKLSQTHAPGLRVLIGGNEIDIDKNYSDIDKRMGEELRRQKYQEAATEQAAPGFPFQQGCADLATEMAAEWTSAGTEPRRVSRTAKKLIDTARQRRRDDNFISRIETLFLQDLPDNVDFPHDFQDFFSDQEENQPRKYLAVIHADTNRMGEKFKVFKEKLNGTKYLEGAIRAESFFARNRFFNRVAVVQALRSLSLGWVEKENGEIFIPWRILMLGGDDLLLVMQAWQAIPFLIAYAKWYEFLLGGRERNGGGEMPSPVNNSLSEADLNFLIKQTQEKGALTFKAGVAIVPVNFPFVASHRLAEQLADSARQVAYGANSEDEVSAVDWALVTTANIDDLDSLRAREHTVKMSGKKLILRGPRPILKGSGRGRSLEELWELAEMIHKPKGKGGASPDEDRLARSKLKALRTALHHGKTETELVAQEYLQDLPADGSLKSGIKEVLEQPWFPPESNKSEYTTDLLELVELTDLVADKEKAK